MARNKEKKRIANKIWRKNNLDKVKNYDRQKYLKMMKNNPDQKRNQTLMSRYGISLVKYNELLTQQNNKCAICLGNNEERNCSRLYVDHCHLTGLVRGLLCRQCNLAIGFLDDNLNNISRLEQYLTKATVNSQF